MQYKDVLSFWFGELTSRDWFRKDDAIDSKIRERFSDILDRVAQNEFYGWRETPEGRLAEILVLDQFSRNIHRGSPRAFAQDAQALTLAQEALERGCDREFTTEQKIFLYLPFMHSESLIIHRKALELFDQPGLESNFDYEKRHLKVIEKFGRYPHRNVVLGRASTPEELEYIRTSPGF